MAHIVCWVFLSRPSIDCTAGICGRFSHKCAFLHRLTGCLLKPLATVKQGYLRCRVLHSDELIRPSVYRFASDVAILRFFTRNRVLAKMFFIPLAEFCEPQPTLLLLFFWCVYKVVVAWIYPFLKDAKSIEKQFDIYYCDLVSCFEQTIPSTFCYCAFPVQDVQRM